MVTIKLLTDWAYTYFGVISTSETVNFFNKHSNQVKVMLQIAISFFIKTTTMQACSFKPMDVISGLENIRCNWKN